MCVHILLSAATIIVIWAGVFIVAVIIVAPVGGLFGWMCLHHKKLKIMNDQVHV